MTASLGEGECGWTFIPPPCIASQGALPLPSSPHSSPPAVPRPPLCPPLPCPSPPLQQREAAALIRHKPQAAHCRARSWPRRDESPEGGRAAAGRGNNFCEFRKINDKGREINRDKSAATLHLVSAARGEGGRLHRRGSCGVLKKINGSKKKKKREIRGKIILET